jgi:hypothetical protein
MHSLGGAHMGLDQRMQRRQQLGHAPTWSASVERLSSTPSRA